MTQYDYTIVSKRDDASVETSTTVQTIIN